MAEDRNLGTHFGDPMGRTQIDQFDLNGPHSRHDDVVGLQVQMAQASPVKVLQTVKDLKTYSQDKAYRRKCLTCETMVATVCSLYSCLVAK
jgi:hypothetical protein